MERVDHVGWCRGLKVGPQRRVEFLTLRWLDSLDPIRKFMGDDYRVSHVPVAACAVLARFAERIAHFEVLDLREQ